MTPSALELRRLVDAYFERHPKASVPSLAKEAGLGASTLRRTLQGETTTTMDTAWAVLGVVCQTEKELFEAISKMFPDTSKFLAPMANNGASDLLSATKINEILRDELRTRNGFIVINLAAMDAGTTREKIRRVAGMPGEKCLERLIDKRVLHEIDGRIAMRSFSHADPQLIVEQVRMMAEVFDYSLLGTPGGAAALKMASLNGEGLELVKSEFRKCAIKIMELTEDPKYSGEIPMAFGAIMTLLDAEALKEGGLP